jgi:hypothetical protein
VALTSRLLSAAAIASPVAATSARASDASSKPGCHQNCFFMTAPLF